MAPNTTKLNPISFTNVEIDDAFWKPRIDTNRNVTLPIEHELCKRTGRIDAWKWKTGQPNKPHIFWDSDIAKWIEAAAYSLTKHPDKALEIHVDQCIDMMADAQAEDGYLNSYYLRVAPKDRWTILRVCHELYCAGHLMEAAVAYYEATGKRKFLDIICRYADCIARKFGPKRNQCKGYPGHPEIELALMKLYRTTGEKKYLDLAKFFVDQRGQEPNYCQQEQKKLGGEPVPYEELVRLQGHIPLREQKDAVGHAVRAGYLYAGMADIAAETNDKELLQVCKRLWRSIIEKRMYIIGGVGSTPDGENFTVDYDMPNERGYAETCAAIALIFFAHRMLQIEGDSQYADVIERALYNNVLSGVSLDGKRFFYSNPLQTHPPLDSFKREHCKTARQEWFFCSCCPPNVARLLASLGNYVYSQSKNHAYVHLYIAGKTSLDIGGKNVSIEQKTSYPWNETIDLTVSPESPASFTLALRIPAWCRNAKLTVNGESVNVESITRKGYAKIKRTWTPGDKVQLVLAMPIERIESHSKVRHNAGKVALQRGPLVYCIEQEDNGDDLHNIILPPDSKLSTKPFNALVPGCVSITAKARRLDTKGESKDLYRPASAQKYKACTLTAIPYCLWANRSHGQMLVWLRQA